MAVSAGHSFAGRERDIWSSVRTGLLIATIRLGPRPTATGGADQSECAAGQCPIARQLHPVGSLPIWPNRHPAVDAPGDHSADQRRNQALP